MLIDIHYIEVQTKMSLEATAAQAAQKRIKMNQGESSL